MQRIVSTPDDLQCIYDHNNKHSSNKSCKKLSLIYLNITIVTSTRESRTNKYQYKKVQLENELKSKNYI